MTITKLKFTPNKFLKRILLIVIIGICSVNADANSTSNNDLGPWSVLLYRGNTAKEIFGEIIMGKYSSYGEVIYAAELAYALDPKNIIRRLLVPSFTTVQIAGNIAYRHDYTNHDNIKEGNLYAIWRWTKFPWEQYLKNTIAIGDGVSYATHPPFADREAENPESNYSNFLNYLMVEVTFALPSYPRFELALRLHHRCTAWGTFPKNPNAGSTNVGVGIRYNF